MFAKTIPKQLLQRNLFSIRGMRARMTIASQNYATTTAARGGERGKEEYSETHSYIKGEKMDLVDHTIGYQLSVNMRNAPFGNAFRSSHQKINWSFSELKRHIEAFACGVVELGLRPGDRMLLYSGSTAEQVVSMGACAKAGAVLVQAQQMKDEKELSRYMELFRPRILVVPLQVQKTDMYKLLKQVFPDLQEREDKGDPFTPIKSKKYPYCKHILLLENDMLEQKPGTHLFFDALVYGPFGYYENPLRRIAMRLTPDDPALILLDDKDVNKARPLVFSHRNLLNAGNLVAQKADIKQGDRVVITQHQQSILGTLANYASFAGRATLVFPGAFFKAVECLKQIDQEQATVVFGTAEDFLELIDAKEGSDLKLEHLKTIVVDASVSNDLISTIKAKFGVRVVQVSGIDEASGVMMIDNELAGNTEFKITRANDGKVVHRDTFGELKIRGPTAVKTWWNDVGLMNGNVDEDGWLNTGKVAKIDNNGKLHVQ